MARVLLDVWESELAGGAELSPEVLSAAFAPAVRLHLVDAYGWLLLEAIKTQPLPDHPPHGVGELPTQKKGLAVAERVEEFDRLEHSGWLADLLSPFPAGLSSRHKGMIVSGGPPGLREFTAWRDALADLFNEMGESAEEY